MADFILSISYGNYIIQNGGTDKVIREHCEMFNEAGFQYLFVFPVVRQLRMGGKNRSIRFWGLDLDDRLVGLFTFNNLICELTKYQERNRCAAMFIHHTWRIEENEILRFCELNDAPIFYFLHDFQSICDNRNFIDGDGQFCGYGITGWGCANDCKYHKASIRNKGFFQNIMAAAGSRICCVAPSENTKAIFIKTFPKYKEQFMVLEHQKIVGTKKIESSPKHILRVAFIGAQNVIKGWDDYKKVLDKIRKPDIELFYLGTGTDIPSRVKSVRVSVREQGNSAMQDALQANKIDVVLLLSCWPETYSYTFFESLSAGCYIITYRSSGNIADQVTRRGCGKVFGNLKELESYLEDLDRFQKDVLEYRQSGAEVPKTLVPNDKITMMVNSSAGEDLAAPQSEKFHHRAFGAELIYRLQNGRKYSHVKK